jgi:hypothetical protein
MQHIGPGLVVLDPDRIRCRLAAVIGPPPIAGKHVLRSLQKLETDHGGASSLGPSSGDRRLRNSTAFGGLFAFAFAYGRMVDLGPRATSALLAAAGFIAVYVTPMLKYPANPCP